MDWMSHFVKIINKKLEPFKDEINAEGGSVELKFEKLDDNPEIIMNDLSKDLIDRISKSFSS